MGDKPARKTPVRTAPARKDYPTEIAWLQAKLEHAEAVWTKTAEARVERLNKRISSLHKQRAELDAKLKELTDERAKLATETPIPGEAPAEA